MKPSKYFGTSEGLVELRPFKTDDGLTTYRPVRIRVRMGWNVTKGSLSRRGSFRRL